jgi:hypothetical protein
MRISAWLTWRNVWQFLALVPGWIAFVLTVRKAWFERTILEFSVEATNVETDDDYNIIGNVDGVPFTRGLKMSVTNNGQRPITIQKPHCSYIRQGGKEVTSTVWVDKKIGQGECCVGFPELGARPPKGILSAYATDTTGKKWLVPSSRIKALNTGWPKDWNAGERRQ